jgi:GNAT superfamily N-acetyltransferase
VTPEGAVTIVEQSVARLAELANVPNAFEVRRRYEIAEGRKSAGFELVEQPVDPPYRKDYDAIESNGPAAWSSRFDVTDWGLLTAIASGRWLGGAVVVAGTPGLDMLEGRDDLALLWDIRVAPENRRGGIGTALLGAVESWARARGCTELKVETQDINVPACRFYARSGFELRTIHRAAYPGLDEVQMLWYRGLG